MTFSITYDTFFILKTFSWGNRLFIDNLNLSLSLSWSDWLFIVNMLIFIRLSRNNWVSIMCNSILLLFILFMLVMVSLWPMRLMSMMRWYFLILSYILLDKLCNIIRHNSKQLLLALMMLLMPISIPIATTFFANLLALSICFWCSCSPSADNTRSIRIGLIVLIIIVWILSRTMVVIGIWWHTVWCMIAYLYIIYYFVLFILFWFS